MNSREPGRLEALGTEHGLSGRATLLLVDDEPDRLRMLAAALEDQYELQLALSGERALALIETAKPSLVLLDMIMPGMDGLAVLARLRVAEATRDLPVIIVTARMDANAETQALEAGANDFIHVPYNPQVLRTRVAIHLEREALRRRVERQRDQLEQEVLQRTLNLQMVKEAADAAAQSERDVRALMEAAPDGILVVNGRGEITMANARVEKLFGMPRRDLIGRTVETLVPNHLRDPHAHLRSIFTEDPPKHLLDHARELVASRADGSEFPVSVALNVYDTRDGRRVICSIRDVSETQAMADALEKALGTSAEANRALQFSLTELESFSYSVSHDLRVLLRVVDGFSHLILERYGERLEDEGQALMKRMIAAEERMGVLMSGLLQLAQISRQDIHPVEIDLSDMVAHAAEVQQKQDEARPVEVKIASGIHARADKELVRMLVDQLIANAWQFTAREEHPVIEFGEETLSSGQHSFFVRDNGIGFDMARVDRLFVAFQHLHGPAELGAGNGVGLAMVSRIVRKHGGQLWAESEPGKGATFYFTLSRKSSQAGSHQNGAVSVGQEKS